MDSTAREEIAFIRGLMDENRRLVAGSWRHQVVWGSLTAAGLGVTWWVLREGGAAPIGWVWVALLVVGWAASWWMGRGEARAAPVRNQATRGFAGIWVGIGITLTLLATVGLYGGGLDPRVLPGVLACVLGAGYWASSRVTGIDWLAMVGVGWWAGGCALLLTDLGPTALLVLAGMTVLLEVLPGLALRRGTGATSVAE